MQLPEHQSNDRVLADINFPAAATSRCGPVEIRADGLGIPKLLEAVLELFPLDTYVDIPAIVMEPVPTDVSQGLQTPPIWVAYQEILVKVSGKRDLKLMERFAFYERAKKAFAIVATGETALYGNLILKKGVISP
uniref:L-fucose mutarotase n=1 Tax=Eptatretus burgeri TaxID=7764 RepID=A0A8C4QD40_EPTBU